MRGVYFQKIITFLVSDFNNKTTMKKNKHIVVFVFGEEATDAYLDGGVNGLRKVIEGGDGRVVKREFDTEAEVRAYQQGVEDMDGWLACTIVDDDDIKAHPRIINNLSEE